MPYKKSEAIFCNHSCQFNLCKAEKCNKSYQIFISILHHFILLNYLKRGFKAKPISSKDSVQGITPHLNNLTTVTLLLDGHFNWAQTKDRMRHETAIVPKSIMLSFIIFRNCYFLI